MQLLWFKNQKNQSSCLEVPPLERDVSRTRTLIRTAKAARVKYSQTVLYWWFLSFAVQQASRLGAVYQNQSLSHTTFLKMLRYQLGLSA